MLEPSAGPSSDLPATLAGMALTTIGMQVFIIQPGFLTALQRAQHLVDAMVGYVASCEMSGIAIATIAAPMLGARLGWRRLSLIGLLVLALADFATIGATGMILLVLRCIAGLGAGLLISIGYAMVGLSRRPERDFGYLIMVVLGYGALGIFALPAFVGAFGMNAVLFALAVMALSGIATLRFVTGGANSAAASRPGRRSATSGAFVRLAAVLAYFIGQGVVWPYLGLIGSHFGLSEQMVANGLTLSQFAGVLGAFATALCGGRVRSSWLVAAGALGSIAPLFIFLLPLSGPGFAITVSVFNLAANMMTALLVGIVAAIDEDGVLVQQAAALQMTGLAIGPALTAYLIGANGFAPALMIAALFFAVSLASSTLGFYRGRRGMPAAQ